MQIAVEPVPSEYGFNPDRYPAWRPGQREVIQQILDWYTDPKGPKVLMLEAPTGVGKSVIALAALQALHQDDLLSHGIVSTATINLQRQYQETIPAPVLASAWGRGNYDCLIIPSVSAADGPCTHGLKCAQKASCTYYAERDEAHQNTLSVLNTAYYMTCINYALTPRDLHGGDDGSRPYLFDNADLAIHDEAHLLEKAVQNLVEASLNASFFDRIGAPLPDTLNHGAWHEFIDQHIPLVTQFASAYSSQAKRLAPEGKLPDDPVGKRAVSQLREMKRVYEELLPSKPLVERTQYGFTFRAVWGKDFAPHYLWRHADKHLLMSATIIHPKFLAESLGLQPDEWAYIEMPSPFAPMRRRIIYNPVVKVTAKTTDQQFQLVIDAMDEAIEARHLEHKGIVHAVSYARTQQILKHSKHRDRMISHGKGRGEKEHAIDQFLNAPAGAILVSPSVGVGEDFGRGENCRFQIFPKYPIPNLGDPVVKARAEDSRDAMWFEADMAFVQAVGRGMRSADDHCTSYVFDAGAAWRFGQLPQSIKDAIVDQRPVKQPVSTPTGYAFRAVLDRHQRP